MRRLLLLVFALSLCLLAYGTAYYPNFPAFWLASGEPTYQIVRLFLAGALFIQFVTHPPRSKPFRVLCGIIAVASALWAFQESAAYHMMYLDSLSILGASIATGITALEISYETEEKPRTKNQALAS